jgi:peroxin-3
LRRLLDETADLIESPLFSQVLTLLLDTTFSHLMDKHLRSQAFKLPLESLTRIQELPSSTATLAPDLTAPKAKLAAILAVITRQAHAVGNSMPNEYVQAMEGVQDLQAFAAVVYSSNYEFGILGDASGSGLGEGGRRPPGASTTGGRRQSGEEQKSENHGASSGFGITDQGTGVFENVWGKVVG